MYDKVSGSFISSCKSLAKEWVFKYGQLFLFQHFTTPLPTNNTLHTCLWSSLPERWRSLFFSDILFFQ